MAEKRKQGWLIVAAGGRALRRRPEVVAQFEKRRLFRLGGGPTLLLPQFRNVAPEIALAVDVEGFRGSYGRTLASADSAAS